jgi:phosphohistidine swiveling domain-containing protein
MNSENTLLNQDSQLLPFDWSELGGKAQGLLWLQKMGARVPQFWILKANTINRKIIELIPNFESLPLVNQYQLLNANKTIITKWIYSVITDLPKKMYAVRSSGNLEDSINHSFAGIYDSYLNISDQIEIAESIFAVFLSGLSERAQKYFIMKQIEKKPTGLSVVIQELVPSKLSGVCFSQNMKTGRLDECWVSAIYGLGEDLVSGAAEGIEYQVDSTGKVELESSKSLETSADLQVVKKVAELTRHFAELYKKPIDLEWAFDGKEIWIVQIRPITTQIINQTDTHLVFDNSNIQESYCGVTTPLTYSYACEAYRKVYSKLMEFLGVSFDEINQQSGHLENMLGFVSGRVYYNINSWYVALNMLPGFRKRKEEMETMMGLENPVDFVTDQKVLHGFAKIKHSFKMVGLVFKLLVLQRNIDKIAKDFDDWFWKLYNEARAIPLAEKSGSELVALTKYYQDRFLEKWAIPVLNDTLVMINMGRLQRILKKYDSAESVKSIIYGQELESLKPTLLIQELAQLVISDSDLKATVLQSSSKELPFLIATFFPEFKMKIDEFIHLYGDRTMGELKLETITFRQDESLFYDLLKNFIISLRKNSRPLLGHDQNQLLKEFEEIEGKMGFFQKYFFRKAVDNTVKAVAHREQMRFHRTRNYGLMRDLYLAVGQKWTQSQILESPRDIFYLTLNEIYDMNFGRNATRSYKKIVELRKSEAEIYKSESPLHQCHLSLPAGVGLQGQVQVQVHEAAEAQSETVWSGLACSQGIVEGEVVFVEDPSDIKNVQGKILLAMRTDPGWTPLFALISGVIIERGSMLSHSAVISREMGIPAVVNVNQITKKLKTGDKVRINGNTGQIFRI